MKKLESSLKNMVLVLVLTALVMSGILALVNHITEGPISEQKEKSLTDGIKTVMGGGELEIMSNDTISRDMDGDQKDDVFIVHRASSGGKELGAAVESTTQGFGGDLKVLVGFDNEGAILGYTILETTETPGLGAKADTWFQKGEKGDIIGKNPEQLLKVKKDDGEVDAITASTITSRAFLKAVNQAYMAFTDEEADAETSATTLKKK
jgi:electron transport complex protein RnfG